jgi:hypothetical protein
MAKTNSTRHYIVRSKDTGDPIALIDAPSVAAARSHFVSRTYTVAYAEQKDVMQAVKAGIEPEKAGDASDESAAE